MSTLVDVLRETLHTNGVSAVITHSFDAPPSLQRRLDKQSEARRLAEVAYQAHKESNTPFWDYLLELAVDAGGETRSVILNEATYQSPLTSGQHEEIPRDLFLSRLENGGFSPVSARGVTALTSQVRTAQGTAHIPMLDFKIRSNTSNDRIALDVARTLQLPGSLFNSGRSYHFYGSTLMPKEQLFGFLGRAQLLSPVVDHRWAAHQLIAGRCALRISPRTDHSDVPSYVAKIGN